MIVWLPPSNDFGSFFCREKFDPFDGLYAFFERDLLAYISEANATFGKQHEFEFIPVNRSEIAPDVKAPVNQIVVRAGIIVMPASSEAFDIKNCRIVLAYVPYLDDDV